ncbi:MAG: hypothetical protein ACYC7E_17630 [Armatimonadota bacterium]
MQRFPLCVLAALLLLSGALAQPDPNNPQPDGKNQPRPMQPNVVQYYQNIIWRTMEQQTTAMLLAPQGLFVLRSGSLARLHPQSLEPQQKIVELFPPLPPQPEGQNATPEAMTKWLGEWAKQIYPAVMLQEGNDLLILIGDQFIRLNADTLEPKFNVVAVSPKMQQMAPHVRAMELLKAPVLLRDPKSPLLYVTRQRFLIVLNVDTGQVVSEKPLPEGLFVKPPQFGRPLGPGGPNPPPPGGQNPPPPGGAPGGPPGGQQVQPGQNAPGAAGQPGGPATTAPQVYTVVGTVVKHQDGGKVVWTLKADNGTEAMLIGQQAAALVQTANIEGRRVRVTGSYTAKNANTPQYAAGSLEVQKYEVLP